METDGLLSRAEMVDAIGVEDDVLGFWLRNDLLVPEPAEPRKHRRFKPVEARIGKVLAELRKCGGNVSAMRALAAHLRRGVELLDLAGLATIVPAEGRSDEYFRRREAYEESLSPADRAMADLGDRLLDGEGLLRLYQIEDSTWKLDDGTYTERLPVKSAVFFDCWQIFDNVRPDLADMHR